jgi:hypothetical protein
MCVVLRACVGRSSLVLLSSGTPRGDENPEIFVMVYCIPAFAFVIHRTQGSPRPRWPVECASDVVCVRLQVALSFALNGTDGDVGRVSARFIRRRNEICTITVCL